MPFCPIKQYKRYAFAKATADKLGGVNKQVGKHLCLNWFENRHLQRLILPVLLLLLAMSTGNTCIAQQEQDLHQPIRVRIFNLRNITAQQAKDYLVGAQVADTILAIPGTTAVSVTGKPEELVQAGTILKLVDSPERFDVQLLDIDADKTLPKPEVIDKQLGQDYSVGTLMENPNSKAIVKAVVDTHKDKLLIISPQGQTQKITEAVQNLLVSTQPQQVQDQNGIRQAPEPQMEQQPQIEVNVPLPNDVDSTLRQSSVQAGSPQVVFVAEPAVIEPNISQISIPVENVSAPNEPKTEDDMLGDMLAELAKTAETEKSKTEPNQLPKLSDFAKASSDKTVAEPNLQQTQQQAVAEQKPVEQQPQEPKVSKSEQETEEIQKQQPSTETEPLLTEAEQVQERLPTETNESVQQQIQEAAVEIKPPVVPAIDIPNGDELLELNLPEKLDVVALIELVGKYLNLNYLYDETKVTGSVTVKVQGRLKVRELYDLLESVLKFRGFVMSRKGKLVTIAPAAEVLEQDPTFVEGIEPGDVVATNVFHLKYINTAAAKRLLGEMKLGSNITEIPETGTLVITEYAFRMQRIEDLLTLVDVPGPPKEFRLRILKYTLAESLVPKIQALAEQLGTVDVTIGTTTPTPETPTRTRRTVRRAAPPAPQPTPETAKKTGVYIDFDKRTNRVLMIGLASEIAAVEQIIDSLDVPQQDLRIIREYEIQYVDIDKIVAALKEFGIVDIVGASTTPGSQAARTPQPQPSPVETAQGPVSLDQPQVVMLESTNSLLVNATPEQHIQISQIISYIDREPVQAAIPYRIYRLENQEPEALAEVLNNLIEKTIKDKEGKIQQTVKYTEEQIAIVPDKNTFSLIVYASKKNQEWIGNLIKTLDRRRPQVLIDVSLVEITRDDKFQFDLDVVANATNLVSHNIAVTSSTINSSFPTASPPTKLFEGGYFAGSTKDVKGFFNEGRIQALFDLIDKKGYGRILARPKILVNDNELGKIERTETEYIAQTTDATLPGATGTTGDTVRVSTTYTPYQAKIALEITPQISEGELLRLEIKMIREDFEETTTTSSAPKNTTASNINTIVTVPDGSTIILGGLTKLNQTKTANKVPLLGDIPIAGTLFRSTGKVDKGNKLYVFVKANILRPEETLGLNQLKRISQTNRDEFEKAESEFQKYEMFPAVKESPLEPEKVLEQDVNESESLTMLKQK